MLKKKKSKVSLCLALYIYSVVHPLIIFVVLNCTVEDNCTIEDKCTIVYPFLPFLPYTNMFIHRCPTSRLIVNAWMCIWIDTHETGQSYKGVCLVERMGLHLPSAVYMFVGKLYIQYAQLSYSSYRCRHQTLSELKAVCSFNPEEEPKDSDDPPMRKSHWT